MPQDPYPKIRFGPVQQPGQTGRTPAEAQYEQAAYSQFLPQAQADPYQVQAGSEAAWKGLDPEAQKRLASLRAALESRIAKGKQEADVRITREGLKGPMERLQQGSPNFGAFMGGYLTPLAGGVDTVLDIGARIGDSLGRAAAGNGGPQGRFEYDYDPNDIFTPGPGLGTVAAPGSKVKYVGPEPVQSGFLEAVAGGAKTPAEARQKFSQGFSGIDPNDMAKLRAQVAEDDKREEQGLPRVLSDEETQTILSAEDPGLPGMAGDTIAMLALTPGSAARGIGGAVSKVLPGAASKGAAGVVNRAVGQAAGEGIAFGATRGITEQSADAGLHDAAFGAGMGGTGAAISSAVGSQAAQRLLAAQSALRGRVVRYLGRTAAETAKLRAGRVAASLLEGGETPSDALNADLAGELGPAALFALGTGGSMARVEQRARANKAGKAMVRAGENQRNAQSAARDLREGFDLMREIEAGDRPLVKPESSAKSRKAREKAEKQYEQRLAERTQGRLKELGEEIQKGLDNKSTRDFAEATKGLRERLDRMDREVAAEQAKTAEAENLRRKATQDEALRGLQERRRAAEGLPPSSEPAPIAKPEAPATAAVGGTAAPAKAAKPGRKPRAITPAEGAWAAEAIQRKARGEKLTAAENRKLEALKDRADKVRAYEAAQRAEAQRQQEASSSPDPRARLSDKGKSMVDQYTAAIQKPMDAATFKALRDQFSKKIRQAAKWNDVVSKTTNENRVSETGKLLEVIHGEAPGHIKKHLLDESQIVKEFELRKALKAAKKSGDARAESEIRAQLRALKRKTTEVTVDRRAKNREEKITREESQQDTPAEEAALAEEFQKVEEIQGLVENLDERALIDWLAKNADAVRADIDAGNLGALKSVLETLPKRAAEGGFTINGGPLGQLVTGMYQLTRKGVVGTAQLAKWAAQNWRQIPSKIRDFFVRVVGSFGHRNMLRQAANWSMSHEGERLVNLTPEGRAKDMAVELDRTVREKAAPAKAEFERRTYEPYAKLVEETSKPEWSKGTEQVTAGGSDWHRWEAEAMGKVSPSAELKAGIDIYNREYTPTTWNVADDLGLTNPKYRGKKIKPGDPPYLLQVFSDNLRSEASTATKSDWWKELEKHVQSMPENKGVPAKDITARLDAIRKIYSGDIEIRTATERKVALEFVREITLPGRFKGKDVTEPRLSEVIKQHYRGASFRAGFEGAFRGREIGDMRNDFIERGGNPNRFDRFIEAAQGTNPRFSDWSSRFYAEHPIAREIMRVVRAGYDFKNTLDLTMSGVSALSDVPFGPSAHLFGKRHYKAVGETLAGFAKRLIGLDKRDAWQIAKSAQELAMRVSDRTRDLNAPIGERIEQSARIARQHIADIMFRPMNRGLETTSTRAFEMMAEDIAKAVTAGKKIPVGRTRQRRLQEFFQWSDDHAKKFFSGKFTNADMRAASEELAAKLYAASSNPMFRSAALKNPIVRYAFRFASHTTQQLRETVKVLRDLARAVYTGKDVGFRSSEAAKYLAQQTLKGGGLLAMKALLNGDNVNPWSEDSNLWAKVKNDPLRGIPSMLWDSLWAGGVMGPYAMAIGEVTGMNASPVQEAAEQYSPVAAKIAGLAALTGPVQMIDEAFGFASGAGSYRDQDIYKRLRTIVEKRIPGTRTATNLLVMGGIARGNKDLDNGISALYRWKRANNRTTFGGTPSTEEGHIQMRRELKEGIRKMDGGQSPAEWIATAITAKGDVQAVADSLRSRKVLDNNIDPADWEELRAEMGEAQFQAVVEHDQLLEEWARYVAESKPEGEPKSKAQAQRIAERSAQKIQRPGLDERARAAASPRAQQLTEAATELMGSRGTPAASRATERAEELKYKSRRRAATRGMDRTGEEVLQRLRLVRQNQ